MSTPEHKEVSRKVPIVTEWNRIRNVWQSQIKLQSIKMLKWWD